MYLKAATNLVIFVILLILLPSCSGKYYVVPTPQKVNANRVPDIELNNKINIINAQKSKKNIDVGVINLTTYEANLNEWTEKAKTLLQSELQKRGAVISDNGLKVLSISVSSALIEARSSGSGTRCILAMHVGTGDGYSTDISVVNNAGIGINRPAGGAITLAITELLNDQTILNYLK